MNLLRSPLLWSRLGLAFCFLGFGIWEIISPSLWTTYIPEFLKNVYPVQLIFIHGVLLTVSALGVLSGLQSKFWSTLSVLILLHICIEIFIQEGFTEILIRDISILLFSIALIADAFPKKVS